MYEPEGFTGLTETICLSHITDLVLLDLVIGEADSRICSYCDHRSTDGRITAVSMDVVGRLVYDAATWLYHDHGGLVPDEWDEWNAGHETDYVVGDCTSGAFDASVIDEVNAHIADAIATPNYWMESGLRDEFQFSWDGFAQIVKYQSRFVYVGAREREGRRNEPPARVSRFLDGLLAYVQDDMLTMVEPGEKLYRARMAEDGFTFRHEARADPAKHLGPAPAGKASAGRLNPEGVGLFYGATTRQIAVKEIALHSLFDDAIVGGFVVQRPLTVLDFTKQPAPPSIFAVDKRRQFLFARFADDFEERLTQSVRLTGVERVEYVVTQIIGEYFRWAPEKKLDGIAWKSHLLSGDENGKNVLVWASADDVRSDPPPADDPADSELWRRSFGPPTPTLTLSDRDVTVHRAKRFVTVSHAILPGDDDPDPMFMDLK
ncbi:RES domain-containing protein [Microbacterium paraoxydans]|uniref:RES domain-containing protein n=1 Tax=Microbacterium paraoxydans TaxID=199592 RepID=UPI001C2CAA65|nr:RES domain-containing protein [Microbacterium paraoxydans]QXE30500.1 RES domain-containing protein [Microbacterium paraoxydans]